MIGVSKHPWNHGRKHDLRFWVRFVATLTTTYIEGILPKGPYLPCVSMAGRTLLAGYPRYILSIIYICNIGSTTDIKSNNLRNGIFFICILCRWLSCLLPFTSNIYIIDGPKWHELCITLETVGCRLFQCHSTKQKQCVKVHNYTLYETMLY